MIRDAAGTRLADRRSAEARRTATLGRTLRRGMVAAMAVVMVGLAGCSGGGDAAGSSATFAPEATTTGDRGGSVEVNVEVGECVALGGSGDFASATPASCGSMEATHKVVGKAPKAEECVADVNAAYYESILGVAETGALCLDIDWVQGHCFDLSGEDPKRVECGVPGPNVVRAAERIEGTSDETACGDNSALAYPVRKFVVCLEQTVPA
jgi:hypothetical protein